MLPVNRFTIILLTCCILLLAGCAVATASPAPTIVPLQNTATSIPTAAPPLSSPTPPATSTPSGSPAATLTPGATITAAPTADTTLAQVKLIGLSWLPNYDFLLTFQFPGPVDPKNYRAMMESKPFTCQTLAQYPNRLYCTGRSAAVQSMAWVRLYQAGAVQPGFEQNVWVPYFTIEHK